MYYNTPSPAIPLKLQHEPWNRQPLPLTAPPAPAPPSPAYPVYPNGIHNHTHNHHHQPQPQLGHAHSNSLSVPNPYAGLQDPFVLRPASPNGSTTTAQTVGSPHWQQQIMKAEACRQSSSPHHRARASAMVTRNITKAAIPITDPNRVGRHDNDDPTAEDENHPSSTVAPVQSASTLSTQSAAWSTLDIGGMRVKNISPSLFEFTHLTTLFLNHNHISAIPSQIERLRALVLLDLSGNQIVNVPPELGMLACLRELYLFDNLLSTLPLELGTLHQLEMLGLEGNPIQSHMREIVQKDGTRALIAYLRDSCPVPAPPPERPWTFLQSDAERKLQENDPTNDSFSVLCYNILCEHAATEKMYGYTPSWALAWEYRKELILTEIMSYDADILCLQEVDIAQYEDYFMQYFERQGYEGVHYPRSRARTMNESSRRSVDGCATFFKKSKYQMVEKHLIEYNQCALQRPDFKKTDDMFNRVLRKDHIAVVTLFENRITGSRLIVANTHVHWDANFRDVKLVQVGLLMEEVEKIADQFAKLPPKPPQPQPPTIDDPDGKRSKSDAPWTVPPTYSAGNKIPTIVCGDFNSVPDSGVYTFLANGSVAANHPDFMSHVYGNFTSEGVQHHMGLKSAYASIGELPLTNYTPGFQGSLDYIWYSNSTLSVSSLLGEVDQQYLSKVVGFPNAHFPSDHICILSEFRVKPVKDPAKATAR